MTTGGTDAGLQMWVGLECTVNRTSHGYANQSALNGHDERALSDLSAFASLGARRIRYPVLWEATAPDAPDDISFDASDERLAALRELGMNPIVGLVHHGSGPAYTSLVDPRFPDLLADYAARVAERYPWVDAYTPVNEPLTTARFSGLYGLWYPHGADDATFCRALYHEIRGTVLAMRAIRAVNPAAALVQTEDLGRASGTAPMQDRVRFENDRRWLTIDLLCGRVTARHPLHGYLTECGGLTAAELLWLERNPCPPDIIGINHYPLSNRFFDHRVEFYPEWLHGTGGEIPFADVGAIDSGRADPPRPAAVLDEVWQRYRRPIAVTEAHIAGGREAQMRWLHELWTSAALLRREGADIVAVTAWSLLGSFDWNTLCTAGDGPKRYESGVFDVRWGMPEPTALATMIRSLATDGEYRHPLLERAGYWREPSRVLFGAPQIPVRTTLRRSVSQPILVLGAGGQLEHAFALACELRGIDTVVVPAGSPAALTAGDVGALLDGVRPWAVIDATQCPALAGVHTGAGGIVHADDAGELAAACARRGIRLVVISSGFVFDGTAPGPYRESDPVSMATGWAAKKAEMEWRVTLAHPEALVIRPGVLFDATDEGGTLTRAAEALRLGETVRATADVAVSPTYVPDLVGVCLDLAADSVTGVLHLTNAHPLSWADWARQTAGLVGGRDSQVVACAPNDCHFTTRLPRYRVLESERADLLPHLDDALERFSRDLKLRETR